MDGTDRPIRQAKPQRAVILDPRVQTDLYAAIGQVRGYRGSDGMSNLLPILRYNWHTGISPSAEPNGKCVSKDFHNGLRIRRSRAKRSQICNRTVQPLRMRNQIETNTDNNSIARPFEQHSAQFCAIMRQQVIRPFKLDRNLGCDLLNCIVNSQRSDKGEGRRRGVTGAQAD